MGSEDKNYDNSLYGQFIVQDTLKIGVCEPETNLIIRKRSRQDELYDDSNIHGILSPYDFVYPLCKQLCCDSISNTAAILISKTVEFRLRQIIEEAIKLSFQRGSYCIDTSQNKKSLPYISSGDINSAMRYLCGSPYIIWSSEKPIRSYYINSKLIQNKELSINDTNINAFPTLPERTARYIPCYSFSKEQIDFINDTKSSLTENTSIIKNSFHKMIKNLNSKFSENRIISLHWLAVDGKFVFSPENDTEFIKKLYYSKKINNSEIIINNNNKYVEEIHMENFGIIINKNNEEYLSEEQKEFLIYMNRIFQRGIKGLHFSWYNFKNKMKIRSSLLNNILNTYGLSDKDFDRLTSILSISENSNLSDYEKEDSQYEDDNSSNNDDIYRSDHNYRSKLTQEELDKIDFFAKINKIFEIIENNTYLEPLLPYIVYFVYYNTSKLCDQLEKTGSLPIQGSLKLLIRISTSLIKNPYCSNTIFYIHKIIEALTKIMIANPYKKICNSIDSSRISTLILIDNLHSRYEASRLIENILQSCCKYFPYGGAKLIQQLNNLFEKLLENRIQNLVDSSCLHIASLYGLICGIRSLGDISINSVLFPKLLTLFSFIPEEYNARVSYVQLHLEIASLLSNSLTLFYRKLEYFNENNSFDMILVYWKKLINTIEVILGDGVLPILLKSEINDKTHIINEFGKAICFLDQCTQSDTIDIQITCPISKNTAYLNDRKRLSKLFITNFLDFYNNSELLYQKYEQSYNLQRMDINSLNSIFKITI